MDRGSYSNVQLGRPTMDNFDAELYEASMKMARAQLARQVSSTSSIHRQRAARVMKANSAGSSPQHVQRKRATTSYRTPRYRPELYQHATSMPLPDLGTQAHYHPSSMAAARPFSWHPSSMNLNRSSLRYSTYDLPTRNSFTTYHTMDIHGLPTPMSQLEMNPEVPTDSSFGLDASSAVCPPPPPPQQQQQQMSSYPTCHPAGPSFDAYPSYPTSGSTDASPYPMIPASDGFDMSSIDYSTQTWAESLAQFPAYTAPPTPDFLPIQRPNDVWNDDNMTQCGDIAEIDERELAPFPTKENNELIGMGLYDKPDRDSVALQSMRGSTLCSFSMDPHRDSLGKGLKLEETWEPPEEELSSDGEDEELESEDRHMEHAPYTDNEEVTSPTNGMTNKAPLLFPQTYGDMSNQSFFFENEVSMGVPTIAQPVEGMSATLRGVELGGFDWY